MIQIRCSGECDGVAINHVVRDCDFTKAVSFFRNEYQIHYMFGGERIFYSEMASFAMPEGTMAFVDKKKIPFTNIIGGHFHNRFLIQIHEKWLREAGEVLGVDLIACLERWHGVMEFTNQERDYIEARLMEMEEAMNADTELTSVRVKSSLIALFIFLMEGAGERPGELRMPKNKMLRYIKVREIVVYIIEHCRKINSLDELAGIFYLDKSYLSRIFKEVTNFTVNEFINVQRIGQARDFLLNTDLSILEISRRLGYESQSYFDRVFLKYVGCSPQQYRKMKRKNDK